MPRLPQLSAREVIARLERFGFEVKRQRGGHIILGKVTAEGEIGCVVPMHHEVSRGTLRSILRQAHIGLEDFIDAR